jgi:hypothetical protein
MTKQKANTINLSRDYVVRVSSGAVVGTHKTIADARETLRKCAVHVGAYIEYPLGAVDRDHVVARQRKCEPVPPKPRSVKPIIEVNRGVYSRKIRPEES